MEKRKFHRIRFAARCAVTHNGITYQGQTENLSLNGALISFTDGIIVPKEEQCNLLIFPEDEEIPLKLVAEVVYSFYTMLGTKFVSCNEDTQARLFKLVERNSTQPDKLAEELEIIRSGLAGYIS